MGNRENQSAWRERKRAMGMEPITIWVPTEGKDAIVVAIKSVVAKFEQVKKERKK